MLRTLLALLAAPEADAELPEHEARLALAALMVRVARADGDYEGGERTVILSALARRHDLSEAEAAALLAEAERAEAAAPDTVRFTRALKRAVPIEARAGLMEAIWSVALADGRRDPEEDAFLRQLAPLLGVEDRDSALARHRAERG